MSRGLTVEILAPTPAGELHPRYDDDAGILVLESSEPLEWPYGMNVNGTMVLDLTADRVLTNVDVHWPRPRWLPGRVPEPTAPPLPSATLVFTEEAVLRKNFEADLTLRTNAERTTVHVALGTGDVDGGVTLAAGCVAFLRGSELAGFLVDLPRAP